MRRYVFLINKQRIFILRNCAIVIISIGYKREIPQALAVQNSKFAPCVQSSLKLMEFSPHLSQTLQTLLTVDFV